MVISLQNTGKRFNKEWIFRKCDYTFQSGVSYAITGPNGSGKSTLLQTIAGAINPSEGKVEARIGSDNNSEIIDNSLIFQHLSIAAPYLEVVEEMTAKEFLNFHASFKPFLTGIDTFQILDIIGLKNAADKQIRYYSSGMKQRVKLAQAIFSNTPTLLLDEPCTNLDAVGYSLYHQLMKEYCSEKLVIVCSNDTEEYDFCTEKINISNYK